MLIGGLEKVEGGPDQEARVGRAFRKLLKAAKIEFTDPEIEEFVNAYKARIDIVNNKFRLIELVKGEKIRHWYHRSNNIEAGELGNSCMAGGGCQSFLDIYTDNPNQVSLAILKDEDSNKIRGRAIVWQLENGDKFLDRAYGTIKPEMKLLEEYANEQGWYYSGPRGIYKDGKVIDDGYKDLIVKLDDHDFEEYPYMDTLSILVKEDDLEYYIGTYQSMKQKMVDKIPDVYSITAYSLESTSGHIDEFILRR